MGRINPDNNSFRATETLQCFAQAQVFRRVSVVQTAPTPALAELPCEPNRHLGRDKYQGPRWYEVPDPIKPRLYPSDIGLIPVIDGSVESDPENVDAVQGAQAGC